MLRQVVDPLTLTSHNFDAFEIGSVMTKEFQRTYSRYESSREIMSATFGVNSPATLEKRANALMRFLLWHKKHRTGFGFPIHPDELKLEKLSSSLNRKMQKPQLAPVFLKLLGSRAILLV